MCLEKISRFSLNFTQFILYSLYKKKKKSEIVCPKNSWKANWRGKTST